MIRLAVIALSTAAFAGSIACAQDLSNDPTAPSGLADRFELIAFHAEGVEGEIPLERWDGDIRVMPASNATVKYWNDIQAIVEELDQLLPQSVEFAADDEEPNLIVLIDHPKELARFAHRFPQLQGLTDMMPFVCAVLPFAEELDSVITASVVMVDVTLGDQQVRRCIAQEITQSIGLPNDIDDPDGTIFSSNSTRETLSESDEQLIRILYDPRLIPGMTRDEAMPIVRQIVAEMEAAQEAAKSQ